MTNAEKYLKEGADVGKLVEELEDYIDKKYKEEYEWFHSVPLFRYLNDFFNIDLNKPIKPTLTEDERVILNHINVYEFDKIARANNGDLYLHYREDKDTEDFWWCNHLFQFIKERRRILNRRIVRRR